MLSSYGARLAGPCRVQCYAAADAFHLVSIAVLYIEQNRRRQSTVLPRSGIRASRACSVPTLNVVMMHGVGETKAISESYNYGKFAIAMAMINTAPLPLSLIHI